MSFPVSFPSQLSAIMEALLKAVVAEVTALVEDGAVELRLELRDRDRQILDKEREIEERDRVIEELRAAVEELMGRGELLTHREEAAVSPVEDRQEEAESCEQEWTEGERDTEDEDTKPFVKSEPTEEFAAASPDSHGSGLWPPPSLSTTADNADTAVASVASSFDAKHETAQSCSRYSQDTEELSHMYQADQSVDTFLNRNMEPFYSAQQPGFSLMPDLSQAQDIACYKNMKKKGLNAKRRNYGTFRCDQCGKTFTAKCRLITHQSVHTGAKPYSCRKCGKSFSRRDNCLRHEKSDPRCKNSPGK